MPGAVRLPRRPPARPHHASPEGTLIRTIKLSDTIAEHLEKLILEGVLRPGERLAAERELADRLQVSRVSLREALEKLQQKGLLSTSKAGTVVAQFLDPLSRPLAALLADTPRATADYLEYRRIIEAQAAAMAATRATAVDRQAIQACCAAMREAHVLEDPSAEAAIDADLHQLVYEAAHNVVVLHVMRVFSELLRNDVLYNRNHLYRRHGVRDQLLAQHLAIADAILAGDPAAAEKAAAAHIGFTSNTIDAIRLDQARTETSQQRVTRSDLLAGS
ncbi:MAG: FCD domain-containing protein [Pseudomonadota bacterium]|nr:FCD domain-containing protein [Pseudomonadota bacterium]